MEYDVAIIGGSLGGVQAAISALEEGLSVVLTEETDWIGGQLTSQAVPPDEHKWIENFGSTKRYREYREKVRDVYRKKDDIVDRLKNEKYFCPGDSWVSKVAHEPTVALSIFNNELQPYVKSGKLRLMLETKPFDAKTENDSVKSVTVINTKTLEKEELKAKMFLDATDTGELLPLAKVEYVSGAESKEDTNEPSAPLKKNALDMQPSTYVVALKLVSDGKARAMKKPLLYDYFRNMKLSYADDVLLSWIAPDAMTQSGGIYTFYDKEREDHPLGLWSYRRIVGQNNYKSKVDEVSLINWPQNDYILDNIYENKDAEFHKHLARQQALSLAYWLQNEAPRADGEKGYNVELAGEYVGTEDGVAKAPYIRESRRIVALTTIKEQDVRKNTNSGIRKYKDSVGVGHYSIDVHMTTKTHTFLYGEAYPFEIPLSAMIPVRVKNLLPACKNIGATHLTNGCYRLHPVEWNIGEVAGYLSAFCVKKNCMPKEVLEKHFDEFQKHIVAKGVEIHWPEDKM